MSDLITDRELLGMEANLASGLFEIAAPGYRWSGLIPRLRAAEAVLAWYADQHRYVCEEVYADEFYPSEVCEHDQGERARAHLAAVRGET